MKKHFAASGRRSFFHLAAAAAVTLSSVAAVQAAQPGASWPTKPVRVVARLISQPVSEALGQPLVIENRGGANGNIGGEAVAKADPDGYTFLFSSGGMVSVNPHLYKAMSFDPAKDLQPVAAASRARVYLVTRPDVPVKDAQEFIEHARKNPGKLTYASPGNGSTPHLAGEMLNAAAGLQTLHVPYRGAAPGMVDLLAGQVDYMFDPGIGLGHVRDGKLRLLAVASPERSSLFPRPGRAAGQESADRTRWRTGTHVAGRIRRQDARRFRAFRRHHPRTRHQRAVAPRRRRVILFRLVQACT